MLLHAPPVRTTTATDGVLLVDKAAGVTSHDVVALARRSLRTPRIGHAGTLDPFATGLLLLLVGRATRLARYVEDEPKIYHATISFGAETSTDDLTGEVVRVAGPPSPGDVDRGIELLTGRILQRPPNYSAKKVAGTRAYAAARAGSPLELAPVPVVVHDWQVLHRTLATLDVVISCAGGTYVRALARDLGRVSGSAAHLTELRRTRCGVFELSGATTMEELRLGDASLKPLRSAIPQLPTQTVRGGDLARTLHGNSVDARVEGRCVALIDDDGELVAIAERDGATLQPRVVLGDA